MSINLKIHLGNTMSTRIDFVTVQKKPNIYFEGRSISYVIECADGSKKTLGVLLPTEKPLTFETHVTERIEIVTGTCQVKIGQNGEFQTYSEGDEFEVIANSRFSMITDNFVDYVCHLHKE